MKRILSALLLVLPTTIGCDAEPEHETCATGTPQTYVVSQLTFARREDGVVAGFDVDDHNSGSGGDPLGCGHSDLVSPDGIPGVDNNFSALIPVFEFTEAVAVESLLAQSIASGELLLTLSIDGAESWLDDDCVSFELGRAGGVPLVAPDGTILDDQTLEPHDTIATVSTEGVAEDGRLLVDGLEFNLPLDVLNAELDFQITRGRMRLQRRYDGKLTGVMGGVLPVAQITELLYRDDVNLEEFAPFVDATADVQDETGACTLLSLGLELEATPVYLMDDGAGSAAENP